MLVSSLTLLPLLVALAASANVVELTPATFDAFVAAERATLVQLYAPWCGHCKAMKPAYEEAATTLAEEGVRLGALDAQAHRDIATRFGVTGFPTILRFVDGVKLTPNYARPRTAVAFATEARELRATSTASKPEL